MASAVVRCGEVCLLLLNSFIDAPIFCEDLYLPLILLCNIYVLSDFAFISSRYVC